MKVFINPCHGGIDCGAVGNGLQECDVVLKIGRRVEKYLQAVGIETKLLQVDGLTAISNADNSWDTDYFVSIHCNSYNTKVNVTETYWKGTTAEKLASAIHQRITKTLPELVNCGVKTASFSVLRNTNMPAALVVTAFIDNSHDAKMLIEREDDFARAITCGVTDFLGLQPDVLTCPTCGQLVKQVAAKVGTNAKIDTAVGVVFDVIVEKLQKIFYLKVNLLN